MKGKAVIPVMRSRNTKIETKIICMFLPIGYISSYERGSLICFPDTTGTVPSAGMGDSKERR